MHNRSSIAAEEITSDTDLMILICTNLDERGEIVQETQVRQSVLAGREESATQYQGIPLPDSFKRNRRNKLVYL